MARHIIDRPFDQERFTELKRAAQTALNALRLPGYMPGKVHKKNALCDRLEYRVKTIEECGEYYYQFDDGPLAGNRLYYTLNNLERLIGRVNKFLGYT